jgi:hypothetical protein
MATPQEQYVEIVKTGQDVVAGALDSFTKAAQQAFEQVPTVVPFAPVDVAELVDQAFDFAEKVLASQRQLAKTLVAASNDVAEAVSKQVESAADTAVQETVSATKKAAAAVTK